MQTFIFLVIEFLDELVFGVSAATTPLLRIDLTLTYAQIGLLLSLPGLIANLNKLFMFILGDVWKRHVTLLAGLSIPWLKLVILGAIGFLNAGWYAILKANKFTAIPKKSRITQALDNLSGMFGTLLPFGIGLAAQAFGLDFAMWLLLAGPLALLVGSPRRRLLSR